MITVPAASSRLMAGSSMIRSGCGEATTRRQPRLASSTMSQPSARRRSACSASMKEPIGLLGFLNAGSSLSTSVWLTSVTVSLSMP